MSWVCGLADLKALTMIGGLTGLPKCMGSSLPALMDLDVRGNMFGRDSSVKQPIPQTLVALKSLRSFIGFHQALRYCPLFNASDPSNRAITGYPTSRMDAEDCKPLMELVVDGFMGAAWQCRSQGWREDMSDLNRPWYQWPKLQRFWVDGNFFYGGLPYDIVRLWPEMRSIDVYGNELTSVSWEAFAELPFLEEIRLQGNYIENAFNATFLDPQVTPRLQEVHLQHNAHFYGCVPSSYVRWSPLQGHDGALFLPTEHTEASRDVIEEIGEEIPWSGRRTRSLLVDGSGIQVKKEC
jgi:hypothetical protein